MRPRELTVRGFRSYSEETTFQFDGRSLIGIVGPIGSGKSSILDAIAFALYGKTPRIERETKSLINQRRDSMHVSLTFDVDGATWKAVRALRRNGQSQHVLYRLDDDGEHEVTDKARDMGVRMDEILGLDFEAFRRSVLLAQNQFAEFLEASPTQRSSVLKGVFGFDRLDDMRDIARRRRDSIGASLQVLSERRASADSDRAALPDKQKALAEASERADRLRGARDRLGELDGTLRDAETRVTAAQSALAELDALADHIPDAQTAAGILEAVTAKSQALSAALEALEAASTAAVEAREAHARRLDDVGGSSVLEQAADLVAALEASRERVTRDRAAVTDAGEALTEATAAAAAAEAAVADARAEADRAGDAVSAAVEAEDESRRALHEAHTADRAGALRAGLQPGDPCPVCSRIVDTIPEMDMADLAAAEAAVATASDRVAAARAADAKAREEVAQRVAEASRTAEAVASASSTAAAAAESLAEAEKSLAAHETRAAEVLGSGDPRERLEELRASVSEAAARAQAADAAEGEARRLADAAREARDAAGNDLDGLRNDLNRLSGRLGMDLEVGGDPEAVAAALQAVREEWVKRRAARDEEIREIEAVLIAARDARSGLIVDAGLEPADDIVEVLTEADRVVTALATEVELIEKRLADLDHLDADEQGLVEQAGLLERLVSDLRPSGFLEYVLGERRRMLADLAGNHLESLTAGRYRFSEDGDFFMLDLSAAEGRRAPASLSGGETFLASLALALALAEIVGREGGRLDAFFLDEGFGSLDPEHIDLAMDGVERLVTSGPDRLVVIVSHVEAMRDRIEDLIVLSRHPITDHTVVESGAALQ